MQLRGGLLLGAAICLSATAMTGAHAQETSSTPSARGDQIETVTVTARKRAESAQATPVAVTAIDEEQIKKLFVHDLSDLDHQAPNFTIEGVGAIHRNAAVIYSRGIGYQGVDMGQDPAVGVSINGVFPTQNIGALSNIEDIDHVEILRGPQGTLFGKNTVGGVINVTTKKPGEVYDVELNGRVGNLGRIDYFAAVDLPVTDTFGMRISYLSQFSSGPYKNAYTGPVQPLFAPYPSLPLPKHLGGDNIKTVRGTMVWTPFSEFEADLVGTYSKDRSASVGGQNGSTPLRLSPVVGGGTLVCPASIPDPDHHLCVAPDAINFFGHPGFDYRTPGLPYPLGPNSPTTVFRNFPSGDFQDTFMSSLNARYHAPGFDIVSVTGYIHTTNLSYSDYDDVELNFFASTFGLHSRQMTEELRAESTGDSPLKWVVGGLYSDRLWDGTQQFYSIFPTLNTNIDFARQSDVAIAAFGQADYTVAPGLELTAGIRYTAEGKNILRIPSHPQAVPTPPLPGFQKVWYNTSYKLGVDYHIDDDKLVYASYSTGFVAGGYNTRVDSAALTGLAYDPEKANALELGIKSDWWDHRLRANIALFNNQYSHLQVGAFIPGSTLQAAIVNNAYEIAQGVESEITVIPIRHLTVSTSVGYLDAHYTHFFADLFGVGHPTDNSILSVARAPQWTGRIQAGYDIDLGGAGTITPDMSYSYESKHFTDTTNNPVGFQKGYGLWDASLTYEDPNDRWRVSLWGKNLTNTLHRLSAVPSSGFFTQLYFAQPRTYGLDLTIKTGL